MTCGGGSPSTFYNHGNTPPPCSSSTVQFLNDYFNIVSGGKLLSGAGTIGLDSLWFFQDLIVGLANFTCNTASQKVYAQKSVFITTSCTYTNATARSDTMIITNPLTAYRDTLPRYAWPIQKSTNRALLSHPSVSVSSWVGAYGALHMEFGAANITATSYTVDDSVNFDYRWGRLNDTAWDDLWYAGDTASPRLMDSVAGGALTLKATSAQIHAGQRTTLSATGLTSGVKHYFKIILPMSDGKFDTTFVDSVTLPSSGGVLIQWNSSGSTDASIAANYSPAQLPTSIDTLIFNTGSTKWILATVMNCASFKITSGYTGINYFNDTLHCNYFNTLADSSYFTYPVLVRDSIVYGVSSKPKGLVGSRIESVPGYTLTVKLNGILNTPMVRNRSRINWR